MQLVVLACSVAVVGILSVVEAGDRSEFEKWMKQETQSYQEYRDKRDKEFTSFLKTQWKEMQTFQGMVRDKTPKPVHIPVAPPKPEPAPQPEKPPQQVEVPEPTPPAVPVVEVPPIQPPPPPVPVKPVPEVELPRGKILQLDYFGQRLEFSYDPKLKVMLPSRLDAGAMSGYWSSVSRADYEPLIAQIDAQKKPLQLNDWGYALLVFKVAQAIYPEHANEQAMFTWFVLTKAGYNARIAYESNRVFLLLPSMQQLFAAPYFTFDNVRYYALSFDGGKQHPGRVFTYDGQYPGASKRLNMTLNQAVNTGRTEQDKTLSFKYRDKTYHIRVGYDRQTVRFLQTYPQMDIGMYFVSDFNPATASPLLQQLKPLVEGKSEQEAVNILLRFVQTAFKYETDEQQFGMENYLFPEETLYYPYSDCEDRSILFAWLVRHLLGLEVVGLDFPGHVATAVHFNEPVRGDSIVFNHKRYVVTDPTYVNAVAGMTMPQYKNRNPGVIRIVN